MQEREWKKQKGVDVSLPLPVCLTRGRSGFFFSVISAVRKLQTDHIVVLLVDSVPLKAG